MKTFLCKIYIAALKTTAPVNPAKTSGRQSKTKIPIVLMRRSVPYQRKALLIVFLNLPNFVVRVAVVITELMDMRKAMP